VYLGGIPTLCTLGGIPTLCTLGGIPTLCTLGGIPTPYMLLPMYLVGVPLRMPLLCTLVGVPTRTCPSCTPTAHASTAVVTVRHAGLTGRLRRLGTPLRNLPEGAITDINDRKEGIPGAIP